MCSFNPRAREGRDLRGNCRSRSSRMFQSTRPRGARHSASVAGTKPVRKFQSTRPRGARRAGRLGVYPCRSFNPRAREGRDIFSQYQCLLNLYSFNPRAREGRDTADCFSDGMLIEVSIHAPARGATTDFLRQRHVGGVSIHAPARGATSEPREPQTRDCVSIHAPARGATEFPVTATKEYIVSIHAPARGATKLGLPINPTSSPFQSTRPRGARPRAACCNCRKCVSIHAPARGATHQ